MLPNNKKYKRKSVNSYIDCAKYSQINRSLNNSILHNKGIKTNV